VALIVASDLRRKPDESAVPAPNMAMHSGRAIEDIWLSALNPCRQLLRDDHLSYRI
jgi:hypothetical protein